MRASNWEELLYSYIEEQNKKPFVWGVNDCCLFAAEWLKRCIEIDLLNEYPCTTAKEALKILSDNNGVDGIADKYLDSISVNLAKRGDLVMCSVDGKRDGLGICVGKISVFKGHGENMYTLTNKCTKAWSVN